MRQDMTFRFIPLDDEPRLAGWIFAVGVLFVSVGSEGGHVVAQVFGCLQGFAVGFLQFTVLAASPFGRIWSTRVSMPLLLSPLNSEEFLKIRAFPSAYLQF